jgi:ribosomal-protein-serine acetyltransferase
MNAKSLLDELTNHFFNLFTNTNGQIPDLQAIKALVIPEGIIIKNVGGRTEIFSVTSFIEPRQKILTDGTLTDFKEEEISETTDIHGSVAHRLCFYKKSGFMSGKLFETTGVKTIQYIKKEERWWISAIAWDDDVNSLKEL